MQVPVDMRFVPRWAWVFDALRNHVERSHHRAVRAYHAIIRWKWLRQRWVASGNRRRSSRRIVELWKSIPWLIGKAVRQPILVQLTEVVVEAAILLHHENDVIHGL